jgi:hypothetical protein
MWRGLRMGLVLDHVNGVWNDNRLENLRFLCPNCDATRDTHCGRKNRREVLDRECGYCGETFTPKYATQRFCSRPCGVRHNAPARHRVERPPYDQLLAEIAATSYSAVGRKDGVSDNAIRKWVRAYERELAVDAREPADQRERPYQREGAPDHEPAGQGERAAPLAA